ncbi:hypothetical protein HDU90_006510 [Geranomyces variabilis]|nr:hypothetical protein HDU90_006510 [Geranomyces variabilis]
MSGASDHDLELHGQRTVSFANPMDHPDNDHRNGGAASMAHDASEQPAIVDPTSERPTSTAQSNTDDYA